MQCMGIVPNVVHADNNASVDQTVMISAKMDVHILRAMRYQNQRQRKMSNENWSCNCMGPQNGEPYCPCMMNRLGVVKQNGRWVEPEKDLGEVIEPTDIGIDKWDDKKMPFSQKAPCLDMAHNVPTHLYIPPGTTYTHTCPSCGKVQEISPPNITFSTEEDEDAFAAESDDEVLDLTSR